MEDHSGEERTPIATSAVQENSSATSSSHPAARQTDSQLKGEALPTEPLETSYKRGTITVIHDTVNNFLKVVRKKRNGVEEIYANFAPPNHVCIPNVCNVLREIPYFVYGLYTIKNGSSNSEMPMSSYNKGSIKICLHKIAP